jgi:hypothetical protein
MPVLVRAWQTRREQWRKEAMALKASYGTLPFRLSYEPAPVRFEEAKGKALATVNYSLERGSDDWLDRFRGLLRKLYGSGAYADPIVEWTGGSQGTSLTTSRTFTFDRPGTYTVSAVRMLRLGGWSTAGGNPLAQQEIRQTGRVDVEVVGPTQIAAPVSTTSAKPVTKPPVAGTPAASDRAPATGAWALEKTEFVVEKVDAAFMQKFQPLESGGDGAGSAQSTFGHPDPKVNTVTVRMKVAWTSPPKVLVPGKEIDFRITVSDAGSDNPKGLGIGGYGSVGANCPSLSDVWSGPAAGIDLKLGERSKEANKAYTPPKAAPGTLLYIIADYGVYSRRQQFIYTYKFTLDAENAPAPVRTSAAPRDKPQADADRLGHEWNITEAVTYPGRWVRRGNSDVWDGTWNNGAVAVLSITIAGDKVKISRKDIGGPSIGATAIYEGTLAADGTMQGTETVTWPGHFTNQVQPWQGRIVK